MTTLIKNGTVYDGSGELSYRADILLQGDRIMRIGTFAYPRVDATIDAMGCAITPGFIDVHPHADHYDSLYAPSSHDAWCLSGVTTVIGGNDGISCAPILHESALHLFEVWGGTQGTNHTWRSFDEFFHFLVRQKLNVNIGTLVGYGTIRTAFTKGVSRDCTDAEEKVCHAIMADAFRHGAFGLSYSFHDAHARGTPYHELRNIMCHPLFRNAVFAFSPRMRDHAHLMQACEELFLLGNTTHANMAIAHIPLEKDLCESYRAILAALIRASAMSNIHIYVPVTPDEELPLTSLLPQFLRHVAYTNPHERRILLEWFQTFKKTSPRIGHIRDAALRVMQGKTFHEIATTRHMRIAHAMLEFLRASEGHGKCVSHGDSEAHHILCVSPRSILSTYTKESLFQFLKSIFTAPSSKTHLAPQEYIAKMTSRPAEKYGIQERGMLREGYFADCVILEQGVVRDCFINGVCTVREGKKVLSVYGGRVLRREFLHTHQ